MLKIGECAKWIASNEREGERQEDKKRGRNKQKKLCHTKMRRKMNDQLLFIYQRYY